MTDLTTLTGGAQRIAADADALALMDIPPHSFANVIWRTGWDWNRARSAYSVYKARVTGELDPDCRMVLDAMRKADQIIPPKEIIMLADLSRSSASHALNELTVLGLVERTGHGQYRVAPTPRSA